MRLAHSFLLRFRTSKQSVDEDRRSSLEDDGGLARAVQRYLPYLEALSQAVAPNVRLRTKHNRQSAQVSLGAPWSGGVSFTCHVPFSPV